MLVPLTQNTMSLWLPSSRSLKNNTWQSNLEQKSLYLPSKILLKRFSTFYRGCHDVEVDQGFPNLICQRAIDASLAVKCARIATGSIFEKILDNLKMAAETGVIQGCAVPIVSDV